MLRRRLVVVVALVVLLVDRIGETLENLIGEMFETRWGGVDELLVGVDELTGGVFAVPSAIDEKK